VEEILSVWLQYHIPWDTRFLFSIKTLLPKKRRTRRRTRRFQFGRLSVPVLGGLTFGPKLGSVGHLTRVGLFKLNSIQ